MRRLVLSTTDIPERNRFAYWSGAIHEIGVPGERDRAAETPFEGWLDATIGASITRFRFHSSRYRVCRKSHEGAWSYGSDRVWLYREIGGVSLHKDQGQQLITGAGDLIIGDPVLPYATEALGNYDHEIWNFPRTLLSPHLPAAQHPGLLHFANCDGLNGILLSYLQALSERVDSLDEAEGAMVADNLCRLIAIACGSRPAEHGQAIRAARLNEVKRYIGVHLSDPGLSPAKAAAAVKTSLRQLHLLFELTDTSFSEYVLRRRLEECRAALTSTVGLNRSVTDIALAWGFNSLPTFYRAFHRAFGASPGEIRRQATLRDC